MVALFYVLLGPVLVKANWPYKELASSLTLVSALAGLAVASIHWRQQTAAGRVVVAAGAGSGCLIGGGCWAAGMLALAFASDSGEHAKILGQLMMGLSHLLILVAPPLGALAATGIRDAWRRRKLASEAEVS
jgi:cytochrome c oxidase assembly factor CtaG